MPVAVAMVDNGIRYLQASALWRADYGLGRGRLRGKSLYELSGEIPSRLKEQLERSLAGKSAGPEEILFPRSDRSAHVAAVGHPTLERGHRRPSRGTPDLLARYREANPRRRKYRN